MTLKRQSTNCTTEIGRMYVYVDKQQVLCRPWCEAASLVSPCTSAEV